MWSKDTVTIVVLELLRERDFFHTEEGILREEEWRGGGEVYYRK